MHERPVAGSYSRVCAGCQFSRRACILLGMSAALDILAIAAHRDDVEQTCGGTLLKAAQRGQRTGILDLTQGEMGTRGTAEDRAREADDAAKILKVNWRRALDIPDGRVENTWENRLKVASVIRETRPRVVILPYWKGRHPDHCTASVLGYEACFLAGLAKLALSPQTSDVSKTDPATPRAGHPFDKLGAGSQGSQQDAGAAILAPHRPFKIVYATLYYDIRPSFVVDISDQFEAKFASVVAYKSQFSDQEAGKDLFPAHNEIRARVEAMARFYGMLGGVAYAEPFLQKEVGLVEDLLTIPVKSV
jgi:LmbE family N-acetylglucosaminyl deacetylase